MKPINEVKLGLILWAFGVFGCLWTVLYVTKREELLFIIFGATAVMGFVLLICGVLDILTDDFEDEIKDSYDPSRPDQN